MRLRSLKIEDAPLMLEWMHDANVVGHLGTNFMKKTSDDCCRFIEWANRTDTDLHLAITDETDTYMGTVSLKHIDRQCGIAEFAITVRSQAMGKGFSRYGMEQILRIGIEELGLNAIYWCVSPENKRAVRFYDKSGYTQTHQVPVQILSCYPPLQAKYYVWYVATKSEKDAYQKEDIPC